MNTNGLQAILEKDEIVPTRLARDFLDHPQEVDDLYKHHVRTYIPLQTGSDEASGVQDFSKKFIKQVKDARAPRGYITADFGYGKTSAGLFVWQQAQNARLIAVPPFKLNRLEDLLDATAGWLAFIFEKTVPALTKSVIEVYRFYHDRELESVAQRYGVTLEQAQRMYEDQALQLSITPKDIVRFFVQMTELVLEAGFEGLVVIPDELQQYLEPEIKSGKIDPLVHLFDIVTDLMDQQGKLQFGFLMIITSKELGVINDQRGDLIDRMRGNTLDLRAIYDREFPVRLWLRFAETLDFEQIASQIVDDFTLEGLGQIASRQDLSNGPRTVINAFRRIARRALDHPSTITPYTPIDLIDDFLNNNIAFDARKNLQEATNRALSSNSVRGHHELEKVVKLLAAFPSDGANREVQNHYGLQEACAELKVIGSPEIVIEVGDRNNPALALRGLDQARENTDELTLILSEFIRNYQPQAANQIERAVNAFVQLLTTLVFKSENWTASNIQQRRFMQNAELVFSGAFPDMVRKFPERKVSVRILGDDETAVEHKSKAECTLTFVLHRHFDISHSERQRILGSMELDKSNYTANFALNLMLPCFDALNRLTQDQLRRVVDVEDVNVLMILALHEFLQGVAERDGVSKSLKEMIQRSMAIRLLETVLEIVLNSAVDTVFKTAGARIIEKTVGELIEARYGEQYHTLITYKQWRDRLRDYISALNQLPSFAQKHGYAVVEGNKDEIAKLFSATSASFDSFQSRFSQLIEIDGGSFPSREEIRRGRRGGIRFTRHPLEETIYASLEDSTTTTKRNGEVRKALRLDYIYGGALELGYREDEIKYILEIMQARDLIEANAEWIAEKPRPDISPRKIHTQILDFKRQSEMLVKANQQPDAKQMLTRAEQHLQRFAELDEHKNEIELIILAEQVAADILLLNTVIEREIGLLRENITRLELDVFNSEGVDVLSNVMHAGAFTTPINQIRTRYDQALTQWRSSASTYQENLAEIKREVDDLSILSLQSVRDRANQIKQKHLDLNEQKRHLITAVGKIKNWQEVSNLLHSLLGSIQSLGKQGEKLFEELQNIENKLVQAFQQDPEGTFDRPGYYQEQLTNLEKQLGQFASRAEREFNQLQDQYRELFIRYGRISRDKLWQKIFYSSTNADGVYHNLYTTVEKHVTELVENLYAEIEQCRNIILATKALGTDKFHDIEDRLSEIEQSIESIDDEYTKVTERASQDTIHDLDKFKKWLEYFAQILKATHDVQASVQQLRDKPQQSSLSTNAKDLVNVVNQLGSSNSLIRIRQELRHMSDEIFWQTVREVWESQLIEVKLNKLE